MEALFESFHWARVPWLTGRPPELANSSTSSSSALSKGAPEPNACPRPALLGAGGNTAVGCHGSRVRALPQATAVSSSATGSRRGAAAKEVLLCGGCRRSRPSISCSGTGCTIRRESGAPAAARGELDVVALEEGSVLSKTRELVRCGRLRVEVEAAAGRGAVNRAARRRLLAPGVGADEGVLRGPVVAVAIEAIPVHCGAWRRGGGAFLDRRWRRSGGAWPGKTRRGAGRRGAAPRSRSEGDRVGKQLGGGLRQGAGSSSEGCRAGEQGAAWRDAAPGSREQLGGGQRRGGRAQGGGRAAVPDPPPGALVARGLGTEGVRWVGRGRGSPQPDPDWKKTWAPPL
ncbi:hypothetical protein PVAP13_3KG084827 [Panicum virgatum]|uniref:Uncharacterized protein n=1 Tax=Panicum virgatum TaxID=38727 RepID=A0A8T0UNK3_PANVG|nr:hypothetical protein PVAP13_3KG084827 [Panicum virgatum]